jgi:glutamate synthase (NADPH/NADH) large chain
VVVLGKTGRNFAAGMSGGIAYLLDLNPALVNTEMVELESLNEEDNNFLQTVIREHLEETGSTVANTLLADWSKAASRFTKIMPSDYKRVLAAQAKAEAEGRDVVEAIMEAARG